MTLYSTTQAGELLGLSPATIQWYCRTWGLGQKPGRNWVLTEEDLHQIKEHMADGPGPKTGSR